MILRFVQGTVLTGDGECGCVAVHDALLVLRAAAVLPAVARAVIVQRAQEEERAARQQHRMVAAAVAVNSLAVPVPGDGGRGHAVGAAGERRRRPTMDAHILRMLRDDWNRGSADSHRENG